MHMLVPVQASMQPDASLLTQWPPHILEPLAQLQLNELPKKAAPLVQLCEGNPHMLCCALAIMGGATSLEAPIDQGTPVF